MEPIEHGPLADVGLETGDGRWTLVFVRELRHPPEKVWAALTEPDQVGAWAPFTAERSLAELGDTTLTIIDGDTRQESPASVRRAEPPALLEYEWAGDLLRWELAPAGTGTRLTLRHTVQDREWLSKTAAGWHLCLVVAERLLDGSPVPPIRGRDAMRHGWQSLNEAYTQKLGLTEQP